MSKLVNSKISKKNPYYISKHRYLELKNFCLQYDEWVEDVKLLNYLKSNSVIEVVKMKDFKERSRVEAMSHIENTSKYYLDIVRRAMDATIADTKEAKMLLFKGITKGLPYDKMIASGDIPVVSRCEYYRMYRRFFYRLSLIRG